MPPASSQHAAGGMPAQLWELRDLLHLSARDVTGATLEARLDEPAFVDRRYIHARAEPVLQADEGCDLAALRAVTA